MSLDASLKLDLYQIDAVAPTVRPALPTRDWMEATNGFANRCLPLTIANSSGWEFLCPVGFTATWDGTPTKAGLTVTFDEKPPMMFASSHFGFGIVTLHPGFLIQTDSGIDTQVMGTPNHIKDGIQALTGIVATDWLPFPFTMNWRMTRPGTVRFEKGEPFCFVTLLAPTAAVAACQPRILALADNPALAAEYAAYAQSRATFNANLEAGEPSAVKSRWQRFYTAGSTPTGRTAPDHHATKRRMKAPVAVSPATSPLAAPEPTVYEQAGYFVRPLARPPGA